MNFHKQEKEGEIIESLGEYGRRGVAGGCLQKVRKTKGGHLTLKAKKNKSMLGLLFDPKLLDFLFADPIFK